ncbi:hypothetical protein ACFX2H_042385 [Malus domestica]
MESDYGITPRMEHYACAVNLYGACGNIELAIQIASHMLDLEPEEHYTYVLFSNMYGHLKSWGEKASVKRLEGKGCEKSPRLGLDINKE